MNMPPRWGFSSFGVGGYNDVAPPELKNGSSAAALTAALIQPEWGQGEGWAWTDEVMLAQSFQGFPLSPAPRPFS